MESLLPALIAALLAGVGDRPANAAAVIATRHGARLALSAAAIATLVACGIAVAGGWLIAPLLTPNAKTLLLALALLAAGGTGLLRPLVSDRAGTGGRGAALVALGAAAIGDRAGFVVFALAARGPDPLLAGAGAALGAIILASAAVALGCGWSALPLRALGRAGAALLLIAGIAAALSGLRLI